MPHHLLHIFNNNSQHLYSNILLLFNTDIHLDSNMSETLIASEKVYNKSQQKVRDIIFKYDSVANLEQLRNLYRIKEGK